jgi:hypothetical protein
MTRLYRPHVPLDVQCMVAMRQLFMTPEDRADILKRFRGHYGKLLDTLLISLATSPHMDCAVASLQLDHDPPLGAREQIKSRPPAPYAYRPDANDPAYLVWREVVAHGIKTRVRGEHGQYSDLALIKRERRRNREVAKAKKYLASRPKQKIAARKKPWPKRKFPKRRKS